MKNKKLFVTIFLSILFPLILFVFSPAWASLFSSEKSLQFREIYRVELSNIVSDSKKWPDLKLMYKDEGLELAQLTNILFTNTGDIPIERSDFDKPITISFDSESEVIGVKKIKSTPENLEVVTEASKNELIISPLLLNSKDQFTLEVLVKGKVENFRVNGRISGIKDINELEKISKNGIYVHRVKSTGPSSSVHLTLFHINEYLMFVFICVALFSANFLKRIELNEYGFLIYIPIFALSGIGVFLSILLSFSVFEDYVNDSKYVFLAAGALMLLLDFFSKVFFKYIYKYKLKEHKFESDLP